VLVIRQGDQPDGQGPATPTRPRRLIDRERCTEDVPALGGEEIPRNDQVACWIAHAQTPEVDDGADLTAFDQQVKRCQVSVDPDGWTGPRGCLESCVPCCDHGIGIEHAGKFGDGGAGLSVSRGERHAAEGVVRPRRWPAGGIDLLQGGYELSQFPRRLAFLGDALAGRGLAFEPPIDGPVPGVALIGANLGSRSACQLAIFGL